MMEMFPDFCPAYPVPAFPEYTVIEISSLAYRRLLLSYAMICTAPTSSSSSNLVTRSWIVTVAVVVDASDTPLRCSVLIASLNFSVRSFMISRPNILLGTGKSEIGRGSFNEGFVALGTSMTWGNFHGVGNSSLSNMTLKRCD